MGCENYEFIIKRSVDLKKLNLEYLNLFETNRVYFLIGSCSCDISISILGGMKKKVSGENIEVADGNQAGVSDELVGCPRKM